MGLQAAYEHFLASPSQRSLADNAVLQYVTTLTSFSKPAGIIRHLEDQQKNVVKKKSEKVISVVEGLTSVALIVETTLQFVSSGGAYLPNLDTFILDREATLPVTHFVHFDQDDKITQLRISWDQGDLLKQVEVIGARGRNWPVYAGKDQIKMISQSAKTQEQVNPAPTLSPRGRRNGSDMPERSASPSKKYIKDPHASLNLYQEEEDDRRPSAPNAVAPRASAKPGPREHSELFAAGHEDFEAGKKSYKENVVAPKGAGHKKFQPSTIFAEDEEPIKETKIYKTNPARYNHFDIGDSYDDPFQHKPKGQTDPQDMPIRPTRKQGASNQTSNWSIEDFTTPEKHQQKIRSEDVVHFDVGSEQPEPTKRNQENKPTATQQSRIKADQEKHFEMQDSGTPVNRPIVNKPRKDADTHFNFTDEPTPAPNNKRFIGRTAAASKLYADPVFGEEEEQPLRNVTNKGGAAGNKKEFASSWDVDDQSPAVVKKQGTSAGARGRRANESHWDF